MAACPAEFIFLGGAHLDQELRLAQPAVMGSSNPAAARIIPGGTALNSAGVAASLGMNCLLAGPVGNDAAGETLRGICRERGIADGLVATPGLNTGSYTVLIEPHGEVLIGAADMAIYDSVNTAWLEEHLTPQLAPGPAKNRGLFATANLSVEALTFLASGTEFSPAFKAAAAVSPAKAARLLPFLDGLDLLFANLAEARALAGDTSAEALELTRQLTAKGVRAGIITAGSAPVTFWNGAQSGTITLGPVTKIVDTNGAGDALAGAVLAMLAKGRDLESAIKTGLEAAAICLAQNGPYPAPQSLRALENR